MTNQRQLAINNETNSSNDQSETAGYETTSSNEQWDN